MSVIDVRPSPRSRRRAQGEDRRPCARENKLGKAAAWTGGLALLCAVIPPLRWVTIALGTTALLMGISALGRARRRSLKSDTAWVAIVLAVLSAFGMVASQNAFAAIENVVRPAPPVVVDRTPTVDAQAATTEEVLRRQLKVEIGDVVTELDGSGEKRAALVVTVTNIGDRTSSFDLDFVATDAKGERITADTAFIPSLGADRSATIRVFNIVSDTLAAKLAKATFAVATAAAY